MSINTINHDGLCKSEVSILEELFDSVQVGLLYVDENRVIIKANKRLADIFGYDSAKEMVGLQILSLHISQESCIEFGEKNFNSLTDKINIDIEYPLRKKDGSIIWCSVSGKALDENKPADLSKGVLWSLQDISKLKETQKELELSNERWNTALSANDDGVWEWNIKANELFVSHRWKQMHGYDLDEEINFLEKWNESIHPNDRASLKETFDAVLSGKLDRFTSEYRLKSKDGTYTWILDRGVVVSKDKKGQANRLIGTHHDITERKKLYEERKEQHKYLQAIIDGVEDPIMVIEQDYSIKIMNQVLKDSLENVKLADPNSPKCYEVSHGRSTPCDGAEHPCPLARVLESSQSTKVIHKHKRADAEDAFVELSATPFINKLGKCVGIIESARDITEHLNTQDKLLEQKDILNYQAHHDALTELPNRVLFEDRLKQSIETSKRKKLKTALMFIDLDHFKEINDSLGHLVGDEVLKIVALRLRKAIRDEDTLARLGGDEFTIVLGELKDAQSSSIVAKTILQTLAEPIMVNENNLYISSSIGISIYPDDGLSTQNLLKYADSAMYKAKEEGRNNYQYYNVELTELAFERVFMETSLREAIKNEEFVVHYQPQVDGLEDKLLGMEALVRWEHPTLGILSPAKFIVLAERTGLIVEIDRYVMRTAMTQMVEWYESNLNPGQLAINLSMKNLEQKDFLEMFKELLQETKCKPEWIELEVTEGQVMSHPEESIEILQELSSLGIDLAIDDFGTGYSSLAYLKKLPINKLKIDQAFVRDLPYDEEDAGITKAVIALARSLNLNIIAEGVETKEQRDFIVNHGCKNIQGYFYSKPRSAKEVARILENNNKIT